MKRKDDELPLFLTQLLLIPLFCTVVIYDIWCLASGNAGLGLYVLPFALGGFIAITEYLRRWERRERIRERSERS